MNPLGEACCSPIFTIFSPDPACRTAGSMPWGSLPMPWPSPTPEPACPCRGCANRSIPRVFRSRKIRTASRFGAGVGYEVERFTGVPAPEEEAGKTRLYHFFNSAPIDREEAAEITVWDWTGDLRLLQAVGADGQDSALPAAGQGAADLLGSNISVC